MFRGFQDTYLVPFKYFIDLQFECAKCHCNRKHNCQRGGLPGVTVIVQGTTNGTITDLDGNYSINVPSDAILVISSVGYVNQVISLNGRSVVDAIMEIDTKQLDEVVVIGYGTQKKSHLTGAISKVTNTNLDQIGLSRADDALIGQVSGVNIQATDGSVGSAPTIRIRGVGSITGGSDPLLVIDGAVVDIDFFGSIDMNDVESFEVLKDAASGAIYGSRGANGVIMITTKQGKEGRTKFSYNGFTGFQNVKNNPDYNMSLAESLAAELAANGELSDRSKVKQLLGVDNNWQDIIFDGGQTTSHSLSARGGTSKTKFSTSVSYVQDEGVLLTDDFKKYNFRAKVDTKVSDKFSFGVSLNPSYTNRRRFDGSTHDILRQPSWLPVYLDANTINFVNRLRDGGKYADAQIGDYAIQRMFDDYDLATGTSVESGGTDISNTSNTNPAAKVLERERRDFELKIYGKVYSNYKITENLTLNTSFTGTFQDTERVRWQGVESNRNGASAARSDFENVNRSHLIVDSYLSYQKTFGNHDVNAVFGYSAERRFERKTGLYATGFTSDIIQTINGGTEFTPNNNIYEREKRLQSFFGRVNYAYSDKYLFSLSVRRDGSSVFGPNKKFGVFPAVSLGWRVSEEDFLSGSSLLNNLKLRVSYGATGNNSINVNNEFIDYYAYTGLLGSETAIVDGATAAAFNPLNIANADLQWEKSIEFNPAIDFGILDNVISGSIDYYKRTSNQLLINLPVSYVTGFSDGLVNRGEVSNEGFEIELRTNNLRTNKFRWTTTFLGSKNKNTLVDFAEPDGLITNVDSKRAAEWINSNGNPISSYYGFVVDKEIPLEFIVDPYHPIGAKAQDVYVKDLNGDGIIDDDDKTILGNPYPDFVWSITNNFKYADFDMSFMFQGSLGAETRNMADQYLYNQFNSQQDFDPVTTPDQGFIKQKIFTNSIIQDASYIALRNVNIGYKIPGNILDRVGVTSARVYVSGQNLIYMKSADYTGFNPESIDNTSPINYGYQRGGSPIPRKFLIGINVEF